MNVYIDFYSGEQKYVDFEINTLGQSFSEIFSANWELLDIQSVPVAKGTCEISEKIISMLIYPPYKGCFTLSVKAIIPPEIIKTEVLIRVI